MRNIFFLLIICLSLQPDLSQNPPSPKDVEAQKKQVMAEAKQMVADLKEQLTDAKTNKEDPERDKSFSIVLMSIIF